MSLVTLANILSDISLKINHQVLGNCATLKFMEANKFKGDQLVAGEDGKPVPVRVLQSQQIDGLIINPIKQHLGRIDGLQKIIKQIREKLH